MKPLLTGLKKDSYQNSLSNYGHSEITTLTTTDEEMAVVCLFPYITHHLPLALHTFLADTSNNLQVKSFLHSLNTVIYAFIYFPAVLLTFTCLTLPRVPPPPLQIHTHTLGTYIYSHSRQLEDINGVSVAWRVAIELVPASVPRDGVQCIPFHVVVTVQLHRLARHLVGWDGD